MVHAPENTPAGSTGPGCQGKSWRNSEGRGGLTASSFLFVAQSRKLLANRKKPEKHSHVEKEAVRRPSWNRNLEAGVAPHPLGRETRGWGVESVKVAGQET